MTRRILVPLVVAVFAVTTISMSAHALDLQAGIGGRIGAGILSDDDIEDGETNTGLGGGVRGWLGLKVIELFIIGVNFDWAASGHTWDGGVFGDIEGFASAPAIGVIIRSQFSDAIAMDLWVDYAFGSITLTAGGAETEEDATGVHLGLDAFYRIQIGDHKTWIEMGPYFTWGSFDNDDAGNNPTTYISAGAIVQATFEIGL